MEVLLLERFLSMWVSNFCHWSNDFLDLTYIFLDLKRLFDWRWIRNIESKSCGWYARLKRTFYTCNMKGPTLKCQELEMLKIFRTQILEFLKRQFFETLFYSSRSKWQLPALIIFFWRDGWLWLDGVQDSNAQNSNVVPF